jgi:hypothetical protein
MGRKPTRTELLPAYWTVDLFAMNDGSSSASGIADITPRVTLVPNRIVAGEIVSRDNAGIVYVDGFDRWSW